MKGIRPNPEISNEWLMHSNLYSVYKSMALACKRNKNKTLEAECIDKMNHHEKERDRCRIILDKEMNERVAQRQLRAEARSKLHKVIDE